MGFFDIVKMLLIAAAEALGEWLPVSNTGHITVIGQYFGFEDWYTGEAVRNLFVASATLGTMLAACALYLPHNGLTYRTQDGRRMLAADRLRFYVAILITWVPCLLLALMFGGKWSAFLYDPKSMQTIKMTMVVMITGGVVLWLGAFRSRRAFVKYEKLEEIPRWMILLLGPVQIIGFLPGASRFGLTIVIAVMLGVQLKTAVNFSVFMSLPAVVVYGVLPIVRNAGSIHGILASEMLTAGVLAFLISFVLLRSVAAIVSGKTLARFGQYRIAFGILLYVFSIL